jgi:radical SAM superfamily enzyme YgiQ (UPF0313 family)
MDRVKRVLLINPPGKKRYLRDCYCSTISKGYYLWQPADILSVSGIIRSNTNTKVYIIDAIAEHFKNIYEDIRQISPHFIFMLTSILSFNEDLEFAERVKNLLPSVRIIGSGEPFLSEAFFREARTFDMAIRDYTSSDILGYINQDPSLIYNSIIRDGSTILTIKKKKPSKFRINIPFHNMFNKDCYWMPFVRMPFATLITDFGCPYGCYFCNSNLLGYFKREIDEVLEDIQYIASLGYKHIFIKDMTFLIDRNRSIKIADHIRKHGLTFNCYSRIDLVDRELLKRLREDGLTCIQLGIESFDNRVLVSENKYKELDDNYIENVEYIFRVLRELGIFGGAHFIIGLPSEKYVDIEKFVNYLSIIKPDYISINLFTPRVGTRYYSDMDNLKKPFENSMANILKSVYRNPYIVRHLVWSILRDLNKENIKWHLKNGIAVLRNIYG